MKMTKEKIQYIATGILFVILVVAIFSAVRSTKKSRTTKPVAGFASQGGTSGGSEANFYQQLLKESKTYSAQRDPFSRQLRPSAKGLSLNGIAWDQKNPTAIVNNEIVQIGSEISGYIVEDILKDRVILTSEEQTIELMLQL